MKFPQATSLLIALFATACVTPSATLTDLTKKNLANATAIGKAHEASLASMDHFIASVESAELAYLREARTKIERLTSQALRSRLDALGAEYRSRFDDGLWNLRGEGFAEIIKKEFRAPFDKALNKDTAAVLRLRQDTQEYPGDIPLQDEYKSASKSNEMARARVNETERQLHMDAAGVTSKARSNFAAALNESLEHYHLLLKGVTERSDDSYSSILSSVEVERVERLPISYGKHRKALRAWKQESSTRLESHVAALETADRYLRGKKLSFLFVEGSEALTPLNLPKVPAVASLGLGDSLLELRAREAALEGLQAKLEDTLARELAKVRDSLTVTVRLKRNELEGLMSFLQMPR